MVDSGVIEQHIDFTEAFESLIDRLSTVRSKPYVGSDKQGLTSGVDYFLNDFPSTFGVASSDGDSGTLAREAGSSRAADP